MSAQLNAQLLSKASSKNKELLLLLRVGLPYPNRRLWYKADELSSSGFPNLPSDIVHKALVSNQANKYFIEKNRYQNKVWYCFDYDDGNLPFDTPMLQNTALKTLKSLNPNHEEIGKTKSAIQSDTFQSFQINRLKEYRKNDLNDPDSSASTPASPMHESMTQDTGDNTPILCQPENLKIYYASKFPKLPPHHVTPTSGRKYSLSR